MAKGTFVITESPPDGSPGIRFEWTADREPSPGQVRPGGARACPLQPWTIAGRLRTVRTDYPGAVKPTEQVLGPSKEPFTLTGRFDDRYNFPGYAKQEMQALEALFERGNPCRFHFLSITRDGLVTSWEFEYRREWWIGYKFTVSHHDNPIAPSSSRRSPVDIETPSSLFDKTDAAVQAMLEVHSKAPAPIVTGSLVPTVSANLTSLADNREALGATLDNRDLRPPENPADAFTRLASQFRTVRAGAFNVLLSLAATRADADLATQSAIGVLDYEDWTRSMRYMARLAMGQARAGDVACTERAAPDAKRLYRPQRGESLYAISRKFYGTPHAWRLIYERNALTSFSLLGTEILVIPERGA